MLVVIGLECGIADVYTLTLMAVCTAACMGLGIVADVLADALHLSSEPMTLLGCLPSHTACGVAHVAGWLLMFAAWIPPLDAYTQSQATADHKAPAFVTAIEVVSLR